VIVRSLGTQAGASIGGSQSTNSRHAVVWQGEVAIFFTFAVSDCNLATVEIEVLETKPAHCRVTHACAVQEPCEGTEDFVRGTPQYSSNLIKTYNDRHTVLVLGE